jgi:hypothetical protein
VRISTFLPIIIIILNTLGCTSEAKTFRDYRKLAFLIDFVSDWSLLNILLAYPTGKNVNYRDKESLTRSYSSGLLRMNEILKLLFALEKKGILGLSKNAKNGNLDIHLNKAAIPKDLFGNDIFKLEQDNANMLKKNFLKISVIKLDTLLNNFYHTYGITKWLTY